MKLKLSALFVLLISGCVERGAHLSQAQRQRLESFVSREAPSPQHPLDIRFEDKLRIIGYDVSAERWAPGATVTVTYHWQVDRALDQGWRIFTHVVGQGGARTQNEDANGTVRELYQPSAWKTGEFVRDEQRITLPADWQGDEAVVYVGIWKEGQGRLPITAGPSDGDDRARVVTLPVGGAPVREDAPPSIEAGRAGEIQLDGRLDEPAWRAAPRTGAFVNTMSGEAAEFRSEARVLWDDEGLYVAFEVQDDHLASSFTDRDDHLWEADCVEVFVDPDGDGRNYFELQVNPRGAFFDTRYDSRRVPQPIGHADWNAEIAAGVNVRGDIDDDDEEDAGYTVEMKIGWESFATGTPPAAAPRAGDTWRLNFYVMDRREDGQRAAAWSAPRVGDFHVPNRFGTVRFLGAPEAAEAASEGAAAEGTAAEGTAAEASAPASEMGAMSGGMTEAANLGAPTEHPNAGITAMMPRPLSAAQREAIGLPTRRAAIEASRAGDRARQGL